MKFKKFKEMMEAADVDVNFNKVCREIANLTDDNEHTDARKVGAELLMKITGEDSELPKEYKTLDAKHMAAGHLTKELSLKRDKLDQELFAWAKVALSPMQYKKFNNAY